MDPVANAYVAGVAMEYVVLRPPAESVACIQCRALKERAERFLNDDTSAWEGLAVLRDMQAHRKLGHNNRLGKHA
jgi:hypothetical protein